MDINLITGAVVNAAYEVHSTLGPGLLESVYKKCLASELVSSGHQVDVEVGFPVVYKNTSLDIGYRVDLLIDQHVIVELKAVNQLSSAHKAQLYTYLKLSGKEVGLLLNFNTRLIKDGIIRVKI